MRSIGDVAGPVSSPYHDAGSCPVSAVITRRAVIAAAMVPVNGGTTRRHTTDVFNELSFIGSEWS
jgi:hypothetical protein